MANKTNKKTFKWVFYPPKIKVKKLKIPAIKKQSKNPQYKHKQPATIKFGLESPQIT